jgi:glycine/D-amino acid oxidase-like deaminating enzyme
VAGGAHARLTRVDQRYLRPSASQEKRNRSPDNSGTDGVVLLGEGSQESLARDDSPEHAARLLARASAYLPALATATPIPVPVGYRPMPIDGLPVLGFAQAVPNLYVALMHSGITLAPLVGELATMEILDDARVDILEHYRPERFDRASANWRRPGGLSP